MNGLGNLGCGMANNQAGWLPSFISVQDGLCNTGRCLSAQRRRGGHGGRGRRRGRRAEDLSLAH